MIDRSITSAEAEEVLRSLPMWFGREKSLLDYARDVELLPSFGWREDGTVEGFATVRPHNDVSAELHCIAVLASRHRRGLGRLLLEQAELWWRERGGRLLQVKTIGPSSPSRAYAETRKFYAGVGFLPLEESTMLWPGDFCLQLVKHLE